MRIINIFFLIIATTLLFCGCGQEKETHTKRIKVENAFCSYHEQKTTIKFSLEGAKGDEKVLLSVAKGVDWITDASIEKNSIVVNVTENLGNERYATLTLSSAGYSSASIKLKQLSKPTATAPHTLMFYFFGTSLNRFFSTNIDDAKLAIDSGILRGNNRIIYFRHRSESEGYIAELCCDESSNKSFESVIEDNIAIEDYTTNPDYISQIINKMAALAPAERYGLVLAGHGHGWITREALHSPNGISQSSLYKPLFIPAPNAEITRAFGERSVQVNSSELASAIENSSVEIDYILFDACFMSSIEAVYELRNATNYIIASPCEIMGRGFPYERTLPHLFKDNGAWSDYEAAAESYYLYYRDEYTSTARCGSIAVFDCSEIEALRDATKEVVKSATDEYNVDALQTYEGQNPHYFYDFGEWVKVVSTDNTAYLNFKEQLDKTVIAKYTLDTFYSAYGSYGTHGIDIEAYTGVTTSAPSSKLETYWKETEWYKSIWQL